MPVWKDAYAYLFDTPCDGIAGSAAQALRHEHVYRYRTKTIRSGNVLECEIYPIWNTRSEARTAKAHITREAQRKMNERNARKTLTRKINANFDENDLCITLTYKGTVPDEQQARKDIRNYMRRVREYRRRNDMPDLKYVYVVEFENGDGGRKKKRVHHHVIMSGMDRDEAERIWGKGYANTRRLQPDAYGLEALARYIVKDPTGSKRWCASRNLKEPKITTADTKISRRKVEAMALDFEEAAPAIFSKAYPDYAYLDCAVNRSEFVAGAYIYARMHRNAAPDAKPPAKGRKR